MWSKSKVIELFDRIYREYPIGSFFLWRAGREHNVPFRHAVELNIPPIKPDDDVSCILDGQQPITLFYVAPRYYREFREEAISEGEFRQIEDRGCPGMGACPVMGTANTMAASVEALGMSLPGNTATPGSDSRLMRIAFNAVQEAIRPLRKGIKPSNIMTFDAFKNAIRVLMAIGGSTNGVLHLQAIASELDLDIEPDTFNLLSKETPFICDIAPSGSGKYILGDFDEAGGIQAVLKELESLLACGVMTVTGRTLKDSLMNVPEGDCRIIYPLDKPLAREGGLIFLQGSLALQGAS